MDTNPPNIGTSVQRANAVEVRHGVWRLETDEEMPNPMFKLVVCSVCNEKNNATPKYCPHCGAKMEGLIW
jgi:rubrerythrin